MKNPDGRNGFTYFFDRPTVKKASDSAPLTEDCTVRKAKDLLQRLLGPERISHQVRKLRQSRARKKAREEYLKSVE